MNRAGGLLMEHLGDLKLVFKKTILHFSQLLSTSGTLIFHVYIAKIVTI